MIKKTTLILFIFTVMILILLMQSFSINKLRNELEAEKELSEAYECLWMEEIDKVQAVRLSLWNCREELDHCYGY